MNTRDEAIVREVAANEWGPGDQRAGALTALITDLSTARRAAHANAQRVTELEAELAYARPMADAAHAFCAEFDASPWPTGDPDVRAAQDALFAAHRAATPSETPSSHVIVERAELERLRGIAALYFGGYLSGVDGGP